MKKSRENAKVNFYFLKEVNWQKETLQLRKILLECGLIEELKWGVPCYTQEKRNIVLIHGFKKYCALLFFKGVLLKDRKGILIRQTENVQSARQIRFTNAHEIIKLKPVLKKYIQEAIIIEKQGLKVELKKVDDFKVADEFQVILDQRPVVKNAFNLLTPGRQRAYLIYFSAAKQSKTRATRVKKSIQKILNREGLTD